MIHALNFHHLRYFWSVAHDGNLSRVAKRLHISQSALSVQVKTLEDRIGQPLFERRGRTLHLTEAGRIALDYADKIFTTGEELIGTLKAASGSRNKLRVGALATLSRNFQIGFLRPMLGLRDVQVVLRSGSIVELLAELESLNLDVVLANHAATQESGTTLVSHRLAEQHVALVGVPARLKRKRALARLLESQPVILPTRGSARTGFDALAHRMGIRPQIAAEVDDMAMMRLLVREGIGLAVLPPIVVKDELKDGVLEMAESLPRIVETFYAITMDRRFPNPHLKPLLAKGIR